MIPFLVVTALLAGQPTAAYVTASSGNLRADRSEKSDVVARLRINTLVLAGDTANGWTEAQFGDLTGFIRAELLSAAPVTFDDAMKRANAAKRPADPLLWAERAWALQPEDRSALELLRALYRAAGRKKELSEVEGALAGRRRIYLALCRNLPHSKTTEVALYAAIEHDGTIRTFEDPTSLLPAVSVAKWWWLRGDATGPIPDGYPQGRIERLPSESLTDEAPPAPTLRLILGQCETPGTIFATTELKPTVHAGFDWAKTAETVKKMSARFSISKLPARIESLRATIITPGANVTEVMMSTVSTEPPLPGMGSVGATLWALFSAGGEVLAALGNPGRSYFETIDERHWAVIAGRRVAVVVHTAFQPESASDTSLTVFVVDADGKVRSAAVHLDHSGC